MRADLVCRRLVIHGLVQGVGYRWSMAREAEGIGGLTGWVRNRRDGTVEAVVAGDPAHVDALIAWAEIGPSAARVTRVTVNGASADGLPARGFEQRPTL
jgi:acylphosphatase